MRLSRILRVALNSGRIKEKLQHFGGCHPQALNMQKFVDFGRHGTVQSSFQFLQFELPVRLANIIKELDILPDRFLAMPSAKLVRSLYYQSFEEMIAFEKAKPTSDNIDKFNTHLEKVLERHESVVQQMAEALIELQHEYSIDLTLEDSLQYFLDRFYQNRISIRMLQYQHLIIFGTMLPESPRHVGCIDPVCDLRSVILDAYNSARFLCDSYYTRSPTLKLDVHNSINSQLPIVITAVPSHIYHIMFELIKNSMRATMERYGDTDYDLPNIHIIAALGTEDLSVRLLDSGGGIPRSMMSKLFRYTYTTAPTPDNRIDVQAPMAGYGYGLPLSRIYARYFLGELKVVSMEGYGTAAYLFLKAEPAEANEVIPVYSTSSRRILTRSRQVDDWCGRKRTSRDTIDKNQK